MQATERIYAMKKYKINRKINYDGREYWIRADSEKEFETKKTRKLVELENNVKRIEKGMKFSAWVEEWFSVYIEPVVSVETATAYKSIMKLHVLPALGNMPLKNIRAIHVQKMLNGMEVTSREMYRKASNLTYRVLQDAKKNNLILENPATDIKLPKGTVQSRRSITDYEREHILKVCQTHRAGTFIYIMLYAGLRTGEVCALQWRNVNFSENYIEVDSNLKRLQKIDGTPKTASGNRKIPLSKPLRDKLLPLKGDPFEYVVKKVNGNQMDFSSVAKMWNSFKHDLNISMGCKTFNKTIIPPYRVAEDLVLYCFRHTFCTDLQDAGVPINVAKELMGHSSVSTTAKIYTHSTKRTFDAALEAMDSFHNKIDTIALQK